MARTWAWRRVEFPRKKTIKELPRGSAAVVINHLPDRQYEGSTAILYELEIVSYHGGVESASLIETWAKARTHLTSDRAEIRALKDVEFKRMAFFRSKGNASQSYMVPSTSSSTQCDQSQLASPVKQPQSWCESHVAFRAVPGLQHLIRAIRAFCRPPRLQRESLTARNGKQEVLQTSK